MQENKDDGFSSWEKVPATQGVHTLVGGAPESNREFWETPESEEWWPHCSCSESSRSVTGLRVLSRPGPLGRAPEGVRRGRVGGLRPPAPRGSTPSEPLQGHRDTSRDSQGLSWHSEGVQAVSWAEPPGGAWALGQVSGHSLRELGCCVWHPEEQAGDPRGSVLAPALLPRSASRLPSTTIPW